jgi:hypothetical protein
MALSGIGNIGLYIQQQLSGSDAQSANAGPAAPITGEASASAVGAGSVGGALGQDLQLFMQAVYEALSHADSTTAKTTDPGGADGSNFSAPAGPTYSKGQTPSLRASAYLQGQPVLHGRVGALISALTDEPGSSSNASSAASSDGGIAGLQAAFSRLLQDLGAANQGASAPASSSINPFSVVSGEGSQLTLNSWLQGLRQSMQQPGTTPFSSVGNLIDVVV